MQDESQKNRNPLLFRMLGAGSSYFVKTPWWMKRIYARRIWDIRKKGKNIYLSFDDGPEPSITEFVLDQLRKYNAKATFFCIGKNVVQYPALYDRILAEGHRTGNHTHTHPNGWNTPDVQYLEDIAESSKYIDMQLFRPPYGKIRGKQVKMVKRIYKDVQLVMWDVLSGDFDEQCSAENCYENVKQHVTPGSIVVFHDNRKTRDKLKLVLPRVLDYFSKAGYSFLSI